MGVGWQKHLPSPGAHSLRSHSGSVHAIRNTRRKMEDRHVVLKDFNQLLGVQVRYTHGLDAESSVLSQLYYRKVKSYLRFYKRLLTSSLSTAGWCWAGVLRCVWWTWRNGRCHICCNSPACCTEPAGGAKERRFRSLQKHFYTNRWHVQDQSQERGKEVLTNTERFWKFKGIVQAGIKMIW